MNASSFRRVFFHRAQNFQRSLLALNQRRRPFYFLTYGHLNKGNKKDKIRIKKKNRLKSGCQWGAQRWVASQSAGGSHLLGHGLRQLLGSLRVYLVRRRRLGGGSSGRGSWHGGSLRVGSGHSRLLREAADERFFQKSAVFDGNCNFPQTTLTPGDTRRSERLHGN